MRYLILENNVVVNAIEADPDFAAEIGAVEDPGGVDMGWSFNGSTFVPPSPEPAGPITTDDVNAERYQREAAGCTVTVPGAGSIPLEGNEKSMRNLQGLAFAASLRIGQGDTTTVTVFRDALNVDHSLVPAQILALWSQGAAYISALYNASWDIKAMDPIPADYADDAHWPAYV